MPRNLPKLISHPNQRVFTQDTEFTRDAVARYICNTLAEAKQTTDRNARADAEEI